MFLSIRDTNLRQLAVAMGKKDDLLAGLKFLGLKSLEMEFPEDGRARLLSPEGKCNKVNLFNPSEGELLAEQLDKNGITISALLMRNDFSNPAIAEEVERILRCVAVCNFFGVQVIRLDPAMHQRGLSVEEAAENTIRVLQKVVAELEPDHKISFGLENHGEYSNNPAFYQMVFSALKDNRIGVTLDSGNFYWFGLPLDEVYRLFTELTPRTKHTHIKNINYPAKLRHRQREMGYKYREYVAPIYQGDIDHRHLIDSLQRANYTGDICIEDESLGRFSTHQWPEILKKDVQHLKNLLYANNRRRRCNTKS